jgi:hypothetical protein
MRGHKIADGASVHEYIGLETDVLHAREHGRAVARSTGFGEIDAVLIASVVSALARFINKRDPSAELTVSGNVRVKELFGEQKEDHYIEIMASYQEGEEIIGSDLRKRYRELGSDAMDDFEITVRGRKVTIKIRKWLDALPPVHTGSSHRDGTKAGLPRR